MKNVYTKADLKEMQEAIYLHDARIMKIIWDYQDRVCSFEFDYTKFNTKGKLTLQGAVYMDGYALGPWCGGVEGDLYIDCFFVDTACDPYSIFLECLSRGQIPLEQSSLPDPDHYFCVSLATTCGDRIRFIVERVVWEVDD